MSTEQVENYGCPDTAVTKYMFFGGPLRLSFTVPFQDVSGTVLDTSGPLVCT